MENLKIELPVQKKYKLNVLGVFNQSTLSDNEIIKDTAEECIDCFMNDPLHLNKFVENLDLVFSIYSYELINVSELGIYNQGFNLEKPLEQVVRNWETVHDHDSVIEMIEDHSRYDHLLKLREEEKKRLFGIEEDRKKNEKKIRKDNDLHMLQILIEKYPNYQELLEELE